MINLDIGYLPVEEQIDRVLADPNYESLDPYVGSLLSMAARRIRELIPTTDDSEVELEGDLPNPPSSIPVTIAEDIRRLVAEHLGVDIEQVGPNTSIQYDIGADSLDIVELVMGIEQEFGIEVEDAHLKGIDTVEDLIRVAAYGLMKKQPVAPIVVSEGSDPEELFFIAQGRLVSTPKHCAPETTDLLTIVRGTSSEDAYERIFAHYERASNPKSTMYTLLDVQVTPEIR